MLTRWLLYLNVMWFIEPNLLLRRQQHRFVMALVDLHPKVPEARP